MANSTLDLEHAPAHYEPQYGSASLPYSYCETSLSYENIDLGNPELPIYQNKSEIISTVLSNDVTIIRSETGSGKSTQVVQYMLEAGFSKVIITQPRIVAARTLKDRISKELSWKIDGLPDDYVGYRTANEGDSTHESVAEIVTDGLEVRRLLSSGGLGQDTILIVDEVHEANANITMLLALIKRMGIRAVIMSATFNTEGTAEYLCDEQGNPAPIIDIEGRTYEVEERQGESLVDEAVRYAKEEKNILIFVPGKPDITRVTGLIRTKLKQDIVIIPLHGEQSATEQMAAFGHYERGKIIIATDIAKTSITIDDIDVVIDCGWERGSDTRQDVPLLDIRPACIATKDQRKGRVGRVKPGIYVQAPLPGYPELPPASELSDYDTPEILKNRLDSLMLRTLGNAAFTLDELDLICEPEEQLKQYAKQRLQRLGAVAVTGDVTQTGIEMAKLPLDAHYARMVVESLKYGKELQVMMLAAVAAHANTTITHTSADANLTYGKLTDEQNSEILMMLDVFIAAQTMNQDELETFGIVEKKYLNAKKSFESLLSRLNLEDVALTAPTVEQEEQLLRCIISGADELYVPINRFKHLDPRGYMRNISKNSPLRGSKVTVVGNPFDIANVSSNGKSYKSLIKGATRVTTQQLLDVAPHRCTFEPAEYVLRYDGVVLAKKEVYFDDLTTRDFITEPAEPSSDLIESVVLSILYGKLPNLNLPRCESLRQTIEAVHDLEARTTNNLDLTTLLDGLVEQLMAGIPSSATTLQEFDAHIPYITIGDLVDTQVIQDIIESTPDYFELDGEKIAIHYKKGRAYITLPSHIPLDMVLSASDIEESNLYVRYRNDGRKYRTVSELQKRLRRSPREKRRHASRPTDETRQHDISRAETYVHIRPKKQATTVPKKDKRNYPRKAVYQ